MSGAPDDGSAVDDGRERDTGDGGERDAGEGNDDRMDPYRWACPRGHVFHRSFDPEGTVECYTCKRTYDAADLVDRRTERSVPPWQRRREREQP